MIKNMILKSVKEASTSLELIGKDSDVHSRVPKVDVAAPRWHIVTWHSVNNTDSETPSFLDISRSVCTFPFFFPQKRKKKRSPFCIIIIKGPKWGLLCQDGLLQPMGERDTETTISPL